MISSYTYPAPYGADSIQGMTRAKRYANHPSSRKYDKATGAELAKSSAHKDAADKLEASNIFREVWVKCKEHKGYQRRKAAFLEEQKEWNRTQRASKTRVRTNEE